MSPYSIRPQDQAQPDYTTQTSSPLNPTTQSVTDMAAAVHLQQNIETPSKYPSSYPRPRLPPILSMDDFHRGIQAPPLVSPPVTAGDLRHTPLSRSPAPGQLYGRSDSNHERVRHQQDAWHGERPSSDYRSPAWNHINPISYRESAGNPLKRPYGALTQPSERNVQYPYSLATPAHTEPSSSPYRGALAHMPLSARSSLSEQVIPSRSHSLAGTTMSTYSPLQPTQNNAHRCTLHIRQQPRAARAGPDGKDRRAVDPPPILQLLINDFRLDSEEDMTELRSSYFVVHCRLVSANSPKKDMSTLASTNDDGSTEVQRLLLGTSVSSPFYCSDDPDPPTMPTHPQTKTDESAVSGPPSPTSRFILPRRSTTTADVTPTEVPDAASEQPGPKILPGTFFIFPDLSIRRAGEYRFEFCLMKIEPATMVAGSRLPILHSVTSQVFRVVNAKDFDQVQPSTDLVKGLLDRGAGFPLKLKKGTREGGRRKQPSGDSTIGQDDYDEDEEEEEEEDD